MGNDEIILKIHHIDIGQGDASLIVVKKGHKTGGSLSTIYKAVLIDSGENIKIGERIVTYLEQVLLHKRNDGGVEHKTLDAIVCTHYDADHKDGFPAIIKSKFCDENTKIYDQGLWGTEGAASKVYGNKEKSHPKKKMRVESESSYLYEKRKILHFKLFCNSALCNQDNLIILNGDPDLDLMDVDGFSTKVEECIKDTGSYHYDTFINNLKEKSQLENYCTAVDESFKFVIDNSQLDDDTLKARLKEKDKVSETKAEQLKNSIKSLQQQFADCLQRVAVTLKNYTKEESKAENFLLGKELFNLTGVLPDGSPKPKMTCIAANGYVLNSKDSTLANENKNGSYKNQRSLAFLIEYGNFAYYTGGDIGKAQEERIAAYLETNNDRKLDAFKVSHHGSDHSTPPALLAQVKNPCAAFISYGWDNSFLHPRMEVIENLLDKKLIVYFTSLLCKVKSLPNSADKLSYSEYKSIRDVENLKALATIYNNQAEIGKDSMNETRIAAPGTIALTVTSTGIGQTNVPLKVSYDRIFFDLFENLGPSGPRLHPKLYSEMAYLITQPEKCPKKDKKQVSLKRMADRNGEKLEKVFIDNEIQNKNGTFNPQKFDEMQRDLKNKRKLTDCLQKTFQLPEENEAEGIYDQFIYPLFKSMVNIEETLKKPRFTWKDGSKVIAKLVDVIGKES